MTNVNTSKSLSPNKMSDSTDSLTSALRGEKIRTFIVSVPIDTKEPKIKMGHIVEILKGETMTDIANHIEEVEEIVQNIQILHVECSKCIGSFNNIFNRCRIKSKVSAV